MHAGHGAGTGAHMGAGIPQTVEKVLELEVLGAVPGAAELLCHVVNDTKVTHPQVL